jgi:hypothetical protein
MFLGSHERTAALLAPRKAVSTWMERMRGLGHGTPSPMDSGEAVDIAKASDPAAYDGELALPDGIAIGDSVLVLPDEYGSGNVAGTLAPSGLHEIAIRHESERTGSVVVHFPRETYAVIATG